MAQGSVLGRILGERGRRTGRTQTQDTVLRDKDPRQEEFRFSSLQGWGTPEWSGGQWGVSSWPQGCREGWSSDLGVIGTRMDF